MEMGFYYLQSRYYDPKIGRFINADSFASTGQGIIGTNMFAYCNNNPINHSDESGTFTEWIGQQIGEWLYELITGDTHPNKQARELETQIISKQHELISNSANELWEAQAHSVELQAQTQYQQDMAVISHWEDTFSSPKRLGDFVNMTISNVFAYTAYVGLASATAVTPLGVAVVILNVGNAVWSTLNYYNMIPDGGWEDWFT